MLFEVIATFETYDQVIFELQLSNINNEKKFITRILQCLSLNEVEDLLKLSICHYAKTTDEYISWLMNRNGKYYFNYDINNDDDTKSWYEFKNNYLIRYI